MNSSSRTWSEIQSRLEEKASNWTWSQIINFYGIGARKNSTGILIALCVFHKEKTPSLKFYPNGGYCCYGCGASGKMLLFVAQQENLSDWGETDIWAEERLEHFFENIGLHFVPGPNKSDQLEPPFPNTNPDC